MKQSENSPVIFDVVGRLLGEMKRDMDAAHAESVAANYAEFAKIAGELKALQAAGSDVTDNYLKAWDSLREQIDALKAFGEKQANDVRLDFAEIDQATTSLSVARDAQFVAIEKAQDVLMEHIETAQKKIAHTIGVIERASIARDAAIEEKLGADHAAAMGIVRADLSAQALIGADRHEDLVQRQDGMESHVEAAQESTAVAITIVDKDSIARDAAIEETLRTNGEAIDLRIEKHIDETTARHDVLSSVDALNADIVERMADGQAESTAVIEKLEQRFEQAIGLSKSEITEITRAHDASLSAMGAAIDTAELALRLLIKASAEETEQRIDHLRTESTDGLSALVTSRSELARDTAIDIQRRWADAMVPWCQGGAGYAIGALALHEGGLWQTTCDTLAEPGANDDWLLIFPGIKGVDVVRIDDSGGYELRIRHTTGSTQALRFAVRTQAFFGTWEKGIAYTRDDTVMHDGHRWIAITDDPQGEPSTSADWILYAMRGPKGRKGDRGEKGAGGVSPQFDDVLKAFVEYENLEGEGAVVKRYRGVWKYNTDYARGDLVRFTRGLWICTEAHLSQVTPETFQSPGWVLVFDIPTGPDLNSIPGMMHWLGNYTAQEYQALDVVRDGKWLMIANKATSDRAAPQPIGAEYYVYEGSSATADYSAKQIVHGNRYTWNSAGYITGYRVYTVTGNHYVVYYIDDPLNNALITPLLDFTADQTGWKEFVIANNLIPAGAMLDVIIHINEPDPTPTTWTGNWNYQTPRNAGDPTPGDAIHGESTVTVISFDFIDDDSGDRTTELSALTIGDTITKGGNVWTIQSVTLLAGFVSFGISPGVQFGAAGVTEFAFETVTATLITIMEDPDYWPTTGYTANGLIAIDGGYGDIVINDNAYGVDLLVQNASISADWDLMWEG